LVSSNEKAADRDTGSRLNSSNQKRAEARGLRGKKHQNRCYDVEL
jgi:hypothetical protein